MIQDPYHRHLSQNYMLIMSLIMYPSKHSSTSTTLSQSSSHVFTPLTYLIRKGRPKFVSLILTESIASSLNVKAQHLQDFSENASKSKICIVVENEQVKKDIEEETKFIVNDNVAMVRVVPMEESSTSVFEMDDLSFKSFAEKQSNDESPSVYLMPQFVTTNSLMAICSIAHEGNLITEYDKIYVNVCNTSLPLSSSGWVNMCRICHGTDSFEELIGPCRCKGSVALAHLSCLERWLRESSTSHCELCLHHYEILREPKYGILKSIPIWMSTPGEHRIALLEDLVSLCLYSPSAIASTYILMLVGEMAAKNLEQVNNNTTSAHFIMFCAIVGIAAIDFTYSSWLMMRLQTHVQNWKTWYQENCCLTLLLPPRKRRRRCATTAQQIVTE